MRVRVVIGLQFIKYSKFRYVRRMKNTENTLKITIYLVLKKIQPDYKVLMLENRW